MLSFGTLSALAARIAARKRGFIAGSGRPILAATVISRDSLPNSLERTASCRPLRCMMFLNWEWPAKGASGNFFGAGYRPQPAQNSRQLGELETRILALDHGAHRGRVRP